MTMGIDLTVEKVEKRVSEATLVVVMDVYYCFLFSRNSGSGCQPRPSRGAYFTIFKINWRTLASRSPDLSRMNFALNSLIRSVRIRRESIYEFAKAETVPSRRKMRVGAALRYCSKGTLFARGLTGSYPPKASSTLWRLHRSRLVVCEDPLHSRAWLQKEPDRGRARRWVEADT